MDGEAAIRMAVALGLLALLVLIELRAPHLRSELPRALRWSNNLALVVVNAVLLRLVFPVTAARVAVWAGAQGWGLFALTGWPLLVEGALAFLILDAAIWAQHRVFHALPWLWRLHRVHHADPSVDATTGLRFHPAEIVISMAIKLALVLLLGPPALAVLIFEITLNATALFSHANIALPPRLERPLRWLIVTPALHRIHHAESLPETDSNFGFCLTLWDRLAGTFRPDAAPGLRLGQPGFRSAAEARLDRLLTQPFRDP